MNDEVIDINDIDDSVKSEPTKNSQSEAIEIVVITDEQGRGVKLSCMADTHPADLIESAFNLLQQLTRAALNNPGATKASELDLGDDFPW